MVGELTKGGDYVRLAVELAELYGTPVEIPAELEQIRGEKAPEGRWNPRTKRREAPGTPSGPVGGALGEPDEK